MDPTLTSPKQLESRIKELTAEGNDIMHKIQLAHSRIEELEKIMRKSEEKSKDGL